MKSFLKVAIVIILSFSVYNTAFAQSCNSLKEIFENSDFCDEKEISLHGKVYEVLDSLTLQGSKYVYGFQFTDDGIQIIRVISEDSLFFVKNDEVEINGRYYKKLYADGLNLDDTIVVLGKNIKVILTGEDYADLLVNYVGKGMLRNEALQRWIIILLGLIPLFIIGAIYFGFVIYKRRQFKGISFEGYVENLFRNNKEWRVEQDNSYRNLRKGWVESYGNPDFVFIHKRTNKKIAVECKYKEENKYERIFWAWEDQIERYQIFSAKEKIPTFVIIGIGGRPRNPKRVFLIPLSLIKYPDVKLEYLQKFERDPKRYFSLNENGDLI